MSIHLLSCRSFYIHWSQARSEDRIRRKILEKVATFTTHNVFARSEEFEASDNTEPEIIGTSGSDVGSSNEGKVAAQSVHSEEDMVDVTMKDAGDGKSQGQSKITSQG